MTQEETIKLAQEAGLKYSQNLNEVTTPFCDGVGIEELQQFAKLVIANIDPSTFMSYQEGYEAGVAVERQRMSDVLLKNPSICRQIIDAGMLASNPAGFKARGLK